MDQPDAQKTAPAAAKVEATPPGTSPWVTGGLSFVAGFADAASFVGADGIFCAHVTGNFVVLAADAALGARTDEWLKLATFPLFVFAVLCATQIGRRAGSARALMLTSGVLLGVAAAVGAVTNQVAGLPKTAIVALLVLAMGVQNAMHRLYPRLGPMTTVMTGNVTGFLVDALGATSPSQAGKQRSGVFVLGGFALGCAAGAFGVVQLGFVALALPALVTLMVRAQQQAEETARRTADSQAKRDR